jgi:hypothetical protein
MARLRMHGAIPPPQHMSSWRGEKCIQNFWQENPNGRDHSENVGVDLRIILELILEKWIGNSWTGFIWLRIVASGGLSTR